MRVALTGATGHLGAAVTRCLLQDGHTVRALVRSDTRAIKGLDVGQVQGDLSDPPAVDRFLDGCDAVIHLAAKISLDGDRDGELYRVNVLGTRALLEASRRHRIRRFVHVASVHAFDVPAPDQPFNETRPLAVHSHIAYERTKALGMQAVLEAGLAGDLEAMALCPTSILGPWDVKPSRQGRMLWDLWRGRMPLVPGGGFDWVDSRDVARAVGTALTGGRSGEAYLLGGRYASVFELVRISRQITGKHLPAIRIPDPLLDLSARLATGWCRATGEEAALTREALHHLRHGHPAVDWSKARIELGYQPRLLEKTLLDTWTWFRNAQIRTPAR